MAIDLFVEADSFETSVPETLRDEYTRLDDGRYVLKSFADQLPNYVKVDEIETHEKTQGLVSALAKERDRAKEAERRAKELESKVGDSMTEEERKELANLREAKEAAEEARRRREGEFDTWRDEIKSTHANEIKDIVGERDNLRQYVCDSQVSRDIAEACNELGGRANILEPLVRQAVQAKFEEGRVDISVMENDTRLLDNDGKPMSIKGFVERMSQADEFKDLFASRQKSGAGSSSEPGTAGQGGDGNNGETPPTDKKRSEMSTREKVDFINEHGSEAFHSLPT